MATADNRNSPVATSTLPNSPFTSPDDSAHAGPAARPWAPRSRRRSAGGPAGQRRIRNRSGRIPAARSGRTRPVDRVRPHRGEEQDAGVEVRARNPKQLGPSGASGRFNSNSSVLPMNRLAISPQTRSLSGPSAAVRAGSRSDKRGQHHRGCRVRSAPSESIGTMVPAALALLAASGPATPSMAPLPNSSGCLESRFSVI